MTGPDTGLDLSPSKGCPHAGSCLWFWVWVMIGAIGGGALLALGTSGLALIAIAYAALSRLPSARHSRSGLLAGAGVICLVIAYLERKGPSDCRFIESSGPAAGSRITSAPCVELVSPIPWLIIGALMVAAAIILLRKRS
jgi:hypothetical protein